MFLSSLTRIFSYFSGNNMTFLKFYLKNTTNHSKNKIICHIVCESKKHKQILYLLCGKCTEND
jgi:hypothetical protein